MLIVHIENLLPNYLTSLYLSILCFAQNYTNLTQFLKRIERQSKIRCTVGVVPEPEKTANEEEEKGADEMGEQGKDGPEAVEPTTTDGGNGDEKQIQT